MTFLPRTRLDRLRIVQARDDLAIEQLEQLKIHRCHTRQLNDRIHREALRQKSHNRLKK